MEAYPYTKDLLASKTNSSINHIQIVWPFGKQLYTGYISQTYSIITNTGKEPLELWLENAEEAGIVLQYDLVKERLLIERGKEKTSTSIKVLDAYQKLSPDAYLVKNNEVAKEIMSWHEKAMFQELQKEVKRISQKSIDRILQ